MGNLSDSMQALVDDITASSHSRRKQIQGLADETRASLEKWRLELQGVSEALKDQFASNRAERTAADRARLLATQRFMDESRRAHQATARTLRTQFAAYRNERAATNRTRLLATQQFMDDVHRVNEQRRMTVSELRSEARNLVKRLGLERQDMAKALQEKLAAEGEALRETATEIRRAAKGMVGELAFDMRQAHQLWMELRKEKAAPEAAMTEEPVEEVGEDEAEREAAPPVSVFSNEERVLEVIARHPEGIRLVDIGNELGVDWRTLLGIARTIVDEDKVERIDNLYYSSSGGPCTTPAVGDRNRKTRRHRWQKHRLCSTLKRGGILSSPHLSRAFASAVWHTWRRDIPCI